MGDVLIPMSTPKPKSAPVQQNIAVEPEDEERQRRIASLERARRSRAATLKTSAKASSWRLKRRLRGSRYWVNKQSKHCVAPVHLGAAPTLADAANASGH